MLGLAGTFLQKDEVAGYVWCGRNREDGRQVMLVHWSWESEGGSVRLIVQERGLCERSCRERGDGN